MNLLEKIETKEANCAVIGLGYVGLPLLCEFARAGFNALGIDVDEEKVNKINQGISYIQDVPTEELQQLVNSGKLKAVCDYSILRDVDIISICVPTPLRKSKEPDISFIVDACSKIVRYLHRGQLIILESTTYPGTTEEIVLPIFTGSSKSGDYTEICSGSVISENARIGTSFRVGEDFFLAFSPERVDPGNRDFRTKDIPKVIGGVTTVCTEVATAFYGEIFSKVVPVSSTRTAEMVKLLENTFRSVNIALANEMALMSDSLDVNIWEVIEAAATKPFGFMPFYPGPGLGGHCIPIDPLYLTWKARLNGFDPKFIELATKINQEMPKQVVCKIQDKLNDSGRSLHGATVIVMGVAYKRDVSDTRESPSIEIIRMLMEKGTNVLYHDPDISHLNSDGLNMTSIKLSEKMIESSDCVVIATDHSNIDYEMIRKYSNIIVDTRNVLEKYKKIHG